MNRKKILKLLIALQCLSSITGCGYKYIAEQQTDIEESTEQEYERGYNLPIDNETRLECERDCKAKMEMIRTIYEDSAEENAESFDGAIKRMYDVIDTAGFPVLISGKKNSSTGNYKKVERFLDCASDGKAADVIIYSVRATGITSQKFIYDGVDMYVITTISTWKNDLGIAITDMTYTRLKQWKYTSKGWFKFEYCVAEPPEVTEIIYGNNIIRIKPFNEEYLEIGETYLVPISYQGNNLFRTNWDADHMENIDYIGIFEHFYAIEYGKMLSPELYSNGIPKKIFEELITKYLPNSKEQVNIYAGYNNESDVYPWTGLGCGNFTPSAIGISYPEVTNIAENVDGTLTLTVDAVCETIGDDALITHEVTINLPSDGTIQYLSNKILDDGLNNISSYQYRLD